jgi:hypothetical protein
MPLDACDSRERSSPGADVAGVVPVPVQMWQGWSQSRWGCGRNEPGPGGRCGRDEPDPGEDVAGNKGASPAPLLDDALDDGPRGSGGGDTERDGLIGIRAKDLRQKHAVSSGAGPFLDWPSLRERAWEIEVLHGAAWCLRASCEFVFHKHCGERFADWHRRLDMPFDELRGEARRAGFS